MSIEAIVFAFAIVWAFAMGAAVTNAIVKRRHWADQVEWTEPFREGLRQRDQLLRENQQLHSMAFQLQVELNAYRQKAESGQWN